MRRGFPAWVLGAPTSERRNSGATWPSLRRRWRFSHRKRFRPRDPRSDGAGQSVDGAGRSTDRGATSSRSRVRRLRPRNEKGTEGGQKREHADDGMTAAPKTLGHLEEWACQRPAVHGTRRFVVSARLVRRHQRLFSLLTLRSVRSGRTPPVMQRRLVPESPVGGRCRRGSEVRS